jgi:hypothetical protein
VGFAYADRAREKEARINGRVIINQPAGKAMRKVLRIVFRVVIVEGTVAKARGNSGGVEKTRPTVRPATFANSRTLYAILTGLQSSARAEAQLANWLFSPRYLPDAGIRFRRVRTAIDNSYDVII